MSICEENYRKREGAEKARKKIALV